MLSKKVETIRNEFFKSLTERKITVAESNLNQIKEEIEKNNWCLGYLNALEGMLSGIKSEKTGNLLINKIDPDKILSLNNEFKKESRNKLYDDFDRGFFTAWEDFISNLKPT